MVGAGGEGPRQASQGVTLEGSGLSPPRRHHSLVVVCAADVPIVPWCCPSEENFMHGVVDFHPQVEDAGWRGQVARVGRRHDFQHPKS